ncbi:MAG: hypothetical protein CAF41_005295 [Nitrospira sp. CG24A]|nr:MAG: hypothetical protein CAF41_005295 [Nitrospira sp. CG24A]
MNRVLGFRSRLVGGGVAVALMIGLVACGGPPKWVKQGSGAFNEKDSKAFYGVGSVSGVRNEPLAWDTAENRARAEIAKTFETYTGYLMRDYAASTTAGDFTKNTEEQNVERAIKTVTFSYHTRDGSRRGFVNSLLERQSSSFARVVFAAFLRYLCQQLQDRFIPPRRPNSWSMNHPR